MSKRTKNATREETCAMVTEPVPGGAPPRMMLRCSRHGQIRYQPPPLPPGISINLPNSGGVYPAGAVGWKLMRADFQSHREGKR